MNKPFETIRIDRDPSGVARLTLNRPEKHNAMNARMIAELREAADDLGRDEDLRVLVLTGEGKSFSAGADLQWMREQFDADRETRLAEARALAHTLRALNEIRLPLIGRINGQAFGGGMGLISICDVVVSSSEAKFGFTETRLGIVPATIGPYCIARMGEDKARRVFMSGRIFDASEAQSLGLVARVVESKDLDEAVENEIRPYFNCAPSAVGKAKALARSLGPAIDEAAIEDTIARLVDCWESTEAQEGIAAFFEKRKPSWIRL